MPGLEIFPSNFYLDGFPIGIRCRGRCGLHCRPKDVIRRWRKAIQTSIPIRLSLQTKGGGSSIFSTLPFSFPDQQSCFLFSFPPPYSRKTIVTFPLLCYTFFYEKASIFSIFLYIFRILSAFFYGFSFCSVSTSGKRPRILWAAYYDLCQLCAHGRSDR